MIEDLNLKHTDELLNYDDEEDNLVGMGLSIRHGDEDDYEYVTVQQRLIGEYGQPVGTSHNNPLLYMRQYEVQYAGRDTE